MFYLRYKIQRAWSDSTVSSFDLIFLKKIKVKSIHFYDLDCTFICDEDSTLQKFYFL